jgi:DNA-binding transcriptional ArsR family regulator
MDTSQIIIELEKEIAAIQDTYCRPCKHGCLLIRLKAAKDALSELGDTKAGPEAQNPAVGQKSGVSGAIKEPAPVMAVSGNKNSEAKRQAILDYLAKHPDSPVREIASAMGIGASTLFYHLKMLGDKVRGEGATSRRKYSLAETGKAKEPEKRKGFTFGNPPPAAAAKILSDKTFHCEPCRATFISQKMLDDHNADRHWEERSKPRKWPCEVCERVFNSEEMLEKHIELRHPA